MARRGGRSGALGAAPRDYQARAHADVPATLFLIRRQAIERDDSRSTRRGECCTGCCQRHPGAWFNIYTAGWGVLEARSGCQPQHAQRRPRICTRQRKNIHAIIHFVLSTLGTQCHAAISSQASNKRRSRFCHKTRPDQTGKRDAYHYVMNESGKSRDSDLVC